ncbi:peptidase S8/S53 domain-containing protein [Cunninghamella echinulata]|nr:peptidase S8/S53 domain-containing protein [Cunninghamella echinulata]
MTSPNDIKKALPHHLTQVDQVHKELGLTGKGVRVCVIDDGIDYNHPALGGGFGNGYKVRFGADFIGDNYNTETDEYFPNPTPLDACGTFKSAGHGTHVSGIIAGEYKEFIGVAPKVELGKYRIFDCKGYTTDDIIIEAILETDKADCDVINMSLGSTNSWQESLINTVVGRLANKGRHYVISAGNSGREGIYTLGQPSTAKGAMSIASFDNSYDIVKQFKATGVKDAIDFESITRSINTKYIDGELVQGDVSKELASNKTCHTAKNVKNKYVLLKVSNNATCTLTEKMALLEESGALAVIYYLEEGAKLTAYETNIPDISIKESTYGDILYKQLNHGKKVHIQFIGQYAKSVKSNRKVSSFSSFGPTYELSLQPHFGGIGGRVYSTLPIYLNSWGEMDGTSMSAPYISGCVALYLEYARKTGLQVTPEYIKEQFQNYALPVTTPSSNDNSDSLLDTPLHQGAGLVQLFNTITKTTHISPGSISFNDTASTTEYKSHTLTITNNGDELVTYQIKNKPSHSINPYNIEKSKYFLLSNVTYNSLTAKLFISQTTVRVQPHQSVQIKVTVVPPKGNNKEHSMYGGFVYFQNSNNQVSKDISVPYFGVIGRQKDIPLFGATFFTDSTPNDPIPLNKTITFHKDSNLRIINLLNMGTSYFVKELVNKETKKVIGYLEEPKPYVPRNGVEDNPFETFSFDAVYLPLSSSSSSSKKKPVPIPKGVYNIVYKGLRMFGDVNNSNDYDTWVSNDVIIKN